MSRISISLCAALLGTAMLAACDDGGGQAAKARGGRHRGEPIASTLLNAK